MQNSNSLQLGRCSADRRLLLPCTQSPLLAVSRPDHATQSWQAGTRQGHLAQETQGTGQAGLRPGSEQALPAEQPLAQAA